MRLTTVGLVCALFLLLFGKICENGGTRLTPTNPTPGVTVALTAPPPPSVTRDGNNDHIINGSSAGYLVTVTRPAGSSANITGTVELHGSKEEEPGQAAFDHVLGTGTTTVSGNTATATITLTCKSAPQPIAGRSGTLAGPTLDSGRGSRVCTTGDTLPCKQPPGCGVPVPNVPPGCGGAGRPRCEVVPCGPPPPGCGKSVIVCKDDSVTVYARFEGVTSPAIGILCIPSVGPTTGSL